jgi:outer membrane protein assembly factor BamB
MEDAVMAIKGATYIASDRLYAVDETGKLYWQSVPVSAFVAPVAVGNMSAPKFRVYVAAGNGTISQFHSATTPQSTYPTGQAMLWSLADANGTLYVGTGTLQTPGQGSVIALDDLTGNTHWTHPLPGPAVWPASIDVGAGRLIVSTGGPDFRLRALRLTDGSETWNEPASAFGQVIAGTVVYYADLSDHSLSARSVINGKLIWKHVNTVNFNFNRPIVGVTAGGPVVFATSLGAQAIALDAVTGSVKWLVTASGSLGVPVAAPDASGKAAFVIFALDQFQSNSFLQARNAQTGALVWTSTTNVGVVGQACTAPIVVPGNVDTEMVQVGTPDGRLVSLRAYGGQLMWQLQLTNEFLNTPLWVPW